MATLNRMATELGARERWGRKWIMIELLAVAAFFFYWRGLRVELGT
jgi:hypothetical protein